MVLVLVPVLVLVLIIPILVLALDSYNVSLERGEEGAMITKVFSHLGAKVRGSKTKEW